MGRSRETQLKSIRTRRLQRIARAHEFVQTCSNCGCIFTPIRYNEFSGTIGIAGEKFSTCRTEKCLEEKAHKDGVERYKSHPMPVPSAERAREINALQWQRRREDPELYSAWVQKVSSTSRQRRRFSGDPDRFTFVCEICGVEFCPLIYAKRKNGNRVVIASSTQRVYTCGMRACRIELNRRRSLQREEERRREECPELFAPLIRFVENREIANYCSVCNTLSETCSLPGGYCLSPHCVAYVREEDKFFDHRGEVAAIVAKALRTTTDDLGVLPPKRSRSILSRA